MEEKQNNLGTFIGLGLIFVLLYLWMQFSAPPQAPDNGTMPADSPDTMLRQAAPTSSAPAATAAVVADTMQDALLQARFGAFSPAGTGREESFVLENDLVRFTFTNKGGRLRDVLVKQYQKSNTDSTGAEVKSPLHLMEDSKNRFGYLLPVNNTASGQVNTQDLYFQATREGNTLVFRAPTNTGGYLEQRYSLHPDNYELDYRMAFKDLQDVIPAGKPLQLEWVNHLDKLEINQTYERTMSSVYFKASQDDPDYCNCRDDDVENLGDTPVDWMAHSNQFFNTALIARNFQFRNFVGETHMLTDTDNDLKVLKSTASIPIDNPGAGTLEMTLYSGPNEFDRLRAYKIALEDIIPFGSSIFGSINRWIIHPIFEFLSRYIGNKGIVILILTFLVKLMVYPLTYRMVYSQAKMAALKPRMEVLKKKHGDDQQAMSVESMKMYSEFGVNPLGGCFPIFLQMPIWFALYRFFPAAIEFRQAGFLWATDLSSYDVAFHLPMMLPGFGNHISAFTLIWVVTTLWYTWYSMKQMDTSAMTNPAMKYMQYLMPVMFMFFFNSFASGLTAYLCFSNILNIGQTVVTKQYFINHEKILAKLEANKAKPRKTGGWRERFEQAMKEQQRVQQEKQKPTSKKK